MNWTTDALRSPKKARYGHSSSSRQEITFPPPTADTHPTRQKHEQSDEDHELRCQLLDVDVSHSKAGPNRRSDEPGDEQAKQHRASDEEETTPGHRGLTLRVRRHA